MYRARTSYDFYGDELQPAPSVDLPFMTLSGLQIPTGLARPRSPTWTPRSGQHSDRPRSPTWTPRGGQHPDRPGSGVRPLSHAYTKGMDRAGQVTAAGRGDDPFRSPMDPVNRQYYYRLWRRTPPQPLRPVYREGRLGGSWRHIKACVNSVGSHFVFVDGNVKSEENFFYPPETTWEPPIPSVSASTPPTSRGVGRDSTFSKRAGRGFQYWAQELKPTDYDNYVSQW